MTKIFTSIFILLIISTCVFCQAESYNKQQKNNMTPIDQEKVKKYNEKHLIQQGAHICS